VNFENMRNESRAGLQGILDEMPRTPEAIDESIARIQEQIDMERPFLDGILFNTNVRPQLEAEIKELQDVKASQERGNAAARDAIPWAQRNVAEIHNFNMSEGTRFAHLGGKVSANTAKTGEVAGAVRTGNSHLTGIKALESANSGKLSAIAMKKTSVTVNTTVYTKVDVTASTISKQVQTVDNASNNFTVL
jgi:DNA repair ATPase RecN